MKIERSIYIVIILILGIPYTPLIKPALENMPTYQILDLIIRLLSSIGALIAGTAVYWKWHEEKNRQIYESRLKEVYAPLMKLLIRQETFRKIYMPDFSIEKAPILRVVKTTESVTIKNGEMVKEINETTGALDRELFIKELNKSNYGLARPNLLSLISQYEFLVEIENESRKVLQTIIPRQMPEDVEEIKRIEELPQYKSFKSVAKSRTDIERKLVQEISSGYNETINKLGMDKSQGINIYNL